MLDQEVLDQLLLAEELIIKAARILRDVQVKSQERDSSPTTFMNAHSLRRRDYKDAEGISRVLFHLVEPYHTEDPFTLTVEELRDGKYNAWAPRGDLSIFRHRYELLTGAREAKFITSDRPYPYDTAGYWIYPKKVIHDSEESDGSGS